MAKSITEEKVKAELNLVKAVHLQSSCEQWGHQWNGRPPPMEGGIMESAPHLPSQSILPGLQREGIYIYWKEMIFLRFAYAPYLIKDICSGFTAKS